MLCSVGFGSSVSVMAVVDEVLVGGELPLEAYWER